MLFRPNSRTRLVIALFSLEFGVKYINKKIFRTRVVTLESTYSSCLYRFNFQKIRWLLTVSQQPFDLINRGTESLYK